MNLDRIASRILATKLAPTVLVACVSSLLTLPLLSQNGDKKGEVQGELPAHLRLPKAPPLDPDAAHAAFEIVDGYKVDLAAAEPLVVDPVQVAFDASGRMWVVEMRGFMPDADGTGELDPVGRIAVLTDGDHDGRFETRKNFLDGLKLPRGVLPWKDGALVVLPPQLVFARDTDGDGVADKQEVVLEKGFEAGFTNPEHAGNAPTLGHDGWIYFANFPMRIRQLADGNWETEKSHKSGQWGMSQDDWGRHAYNYNSSWLHGDRYSPHYAVRNSALGVAAGINERFTSDQGLWPIRPNPGINRGYQKGMLTKDGKLARTTAVCGPGFYRGGLLPDEWIGDVFVPEPAANLVRHMKIEEDASGKRVAKNAHGRREFLASTDERFRPVQCLTGPDGALYVVDLYRGILQHRVFMTTFLRKQVDGRGLATPVGLGRIWRIVPDDVAVSASQPLPTTMIELVPHLGHRNGVVRELAQAALLEASEREGSNPLCVQGLETNLGVPLSIKGQNVSGRNSSPHARYHALWTLHLLGHLQGKHLTIALRDEEPRIRAVAVRLSEAHPSFDLSPALGDSSPIVQTQLALSLSSAKDGARIALLATLLAKHGDDRVIRQAAVTGLAGREAAFVKTLTELPTWKSAPDGGSAFLRRCAQIVTKRRDADAVVALLADATACKEKWQRDAIVRGCVEGLPRGNARKASIRAKKKTPILAELATAGCNTKHIASLREAITWPGATNAVTVAKLTKDEERLVKLGKHYFVAHCVQCHQADGRGQSGLAPSLHDSPIVLGPAARQIRVILHGVTGPVEIGGKVQDLTMEPLGEKLNDRQIAAILTYTRRSWGHRAPAVHPTEVKRVRGETGGRKAPWRREELQRIE